MSALGGESGGGIFGFAEDVGRLVLAADVGETFQLAGAGGGEQNFASIRELRFHVRHAGDYVAVKSRAWPGRKFELGDRSYTQCALLEIDPRGFFESGGGLPFCP